MGIESLIDIAIFINMEFVDVKVPEDALGPGRGLLAEIFNMKVLTFKFVATSVKMFLDIKCNLQYSYNYLILNHGATLYSLIFTV